MSEEMLYTVNEVAKILKTNVNYFLEDTVVEGK